MILQDEIRVKIPPKFLDLFEDKTKRYYIYYGGRGSGKSWSIARYLLITALSGKFRILCTREIQSSLSDSVMRLLTDSIVELKLTRFFTITQSNIKSITGSEFFFAGLRQNIQSIRSMEGIDVVWIEEAHSISRHSMDTLIPTIRKPNSFFVITFNPTNETDPVYEMFVKTKRDDTIAVMVNWVDNPYFPDVLKKEKDWMKATDYERYEHVWMGKTLSYSAAQIFKGKVLVQEFESNEDTTTYYFGLDFGFSVDPSALIRCFMLDGNLYLDYEFHVYGMELEDLAKMLHQVPGIRRGNLYCDCSRPESIAFLVRAGLRAFPCDKWQGSVEDGIAYLKSFKNIIIHPRCKNSIWEYSQYSYKTDKMTEDVLPIVLDKNNHIPDATRYALNNYIKTTGSILDVL